jgi:hypothetical protein
MTTGKLVSFSQKGFFDGDKEHPAKHIRLSTAIAASSAFPPLFPPVAVSAKELLVKKEDFPLGTEQLTDGGVYDNVGLSKLIHDSERGAHDTGQSVVLVSDASAPFEWAVAKAFGFVLARTVRTTDLLMKRVAELEESRVRGDAARHADGCEPIVIGIESVVPESGALSGGPRAFAVQDEVVQKLVARIRTDLDRFSSEEMCSLVRHGYEVGIKILGEHRMLPKEFRPKDPWSSFGLSAPRANTWRFRLTRQSGVEVLRRAIGRAATRRTLLWSVRDWVSWLQLTLLFVGLWLVWFV